jgi:hypothetical protein
MPDDVAVPSIGPRMVCTRCGYVGRRREAELERIEQVRQKIGNRVRFRGTPAVRMVTGAERVSRN